MPFNVGDPTGAELDHPPDEALNLFSSNCCVGDWNMLLHEAPQEREPCAQTPLLIEPFSTLPPSYPVPSPFPELARVEETLKDLSMPSYPNRSYCLYTSEPMTSQCQVSECNQPFFTDDLRYDLPKLGSDFSPDLNVCDIFKDTDDESDIIVEESDTESEISISDVHEPQSDPSMSCIVCNLPFGDAASVNFLQLSNNFPLTYISKTPIIMKLIEILPFDIQNLIKFENTLICRRCLQLVNSVENLEFHLNSIKQELCNHVSRARAVISSQLGQTETVERPPCLFQEQPLPSEPKIFEPLPEVHQKEPQLEVSQPECYEKENTAPMPQKVPTSNSTRQKTDGSRHQCDRCGRTYSKLCRLTNHLAKHTGSFRFSCEYCKKGFMFEAFFQMHLRRHKAERPFQCPNCPASFTQEPHLKEHVCDGKRFMCTECPRAYSSQLTLDHHVQISHRKRKHVCEVCSKEFDHPSDLLIHSASHRSERPFQCSLCSNSYKRSSHLKRHISSIHSKQKTEKKESSGESVCSDCGKVFADKKYLRAHEKLHRGTAKLNTCPICHKSFRVSLKIHMVRHAATKNYKCSKCDLKFSHKQAYEKHCLKKHEGILS